MRIDYKIITDLIPNGSKVMDLGCGEGDLLTDLITQKQVEGTGIEISLPKVQAAIAKGVSVIQGDLEDQIKNYSTNSFDYCILSQTLQELHQPDFVLEHMLRISKKVIVAFYNLAHFKYRFQILFSGRFPKSKDLPYNWLTTNITLLSVNDFQEFCNLHQIRITNSIFLDLKKRINIWPNLRAKICVFELSNGK